jgi:hypothetical protein
MSYLLRMPIKAVNPTQHLAALVNLNKTVEHLYYEHVSKRLHVLKMFANLVLMNEQR